MISKIWEERILREVMNDGKKDWWCWECGESPCSCGDKDFAFSESIVKQMILQAINLTSNVYTSNVHIAKPMQTQCRHNAASMQGASK